MGARALAPGGHAVAGAEPDVISYNAAISACAKGLQWERALSLLDEMQARGLEPNVISFNAAISACKNAGRSERARSLLEEIPRRGLKPDVISFNTFISACEKGTQPEDALSVLDEMKLSGLEPDVISYNSAISACGKSGKVAASARAPRPDAGARFRAGRDQLQRGDLGMREGGKWERALALLDEMPQRSLEPNVISFNAAISACEKGSQWERALSLLEDMQSRGLNPDVISYNAGDVGVQEKCAVGTRALAPGRDAGARARAGRDQLQRGHPGVRGGRAGRARARAPR